MSESEDDMSKQIKERVEIGRDDNNRPIYKWVSGCSKQEFLKNAAKLIAEVWNVKPSQKLECPVFEAYANNWLKIYKKESIRHTTASEYRSVLNKHLIPVFGSLSIDKITSDTIQAFLNERKNYSEKSLREMRMILGMILEGAIEDGFITRNPAKSKRLMIPSKKKAPRKALTEAEIFDVIHSIPSIREQKDRRYVALLLYTGMRREEVLGLRWADVDTTNLRIHVHNAITFKGNMPVEGPPKTEKGNRVIPINPALLPWLTHSDENQEFVLLDSITQQKIKRMWQRISRQINVYGATPHCFRHTFTTLCHRRGMDDKTLQSIGGWADVSTMRDIYTHTQEKDIEKAAAMMNTIFSSFCDTECDKPD